LGYAQVVPEKIRMSRETIFDLASITKPIATALSIMKLYEEKEIKLEERVSRFLINFKNMPNGSITIKQLLTHTSGMPSWFPLYILPEEKRLKFLATENNGRYEVVYSCLGYIVLGMIIEKITNMKLNQYCDNKIFKKLDLKGTMFKPKQTLKNIAATELGNVYEKRRAKKYGDVSRIKWRRHLIRGEVHDGNAYYCFKGVAGNAGLFSNARDLLGLSKDIVSGRIIKSSTMRLMMKDHTGGKEKRGLGWVINPYPGLLSPETFGHTGFTGTMLLIDPQKNLIIILLANSVHPKVKLGVMAPIRKKVVQTASEMRLC
jgi:CubicO group peptidase (beta-lactamase class C family)